MKKLSIWIMITIMVLSLCGCRPEAGVGAGSTGAATESGQTETAAQNTEATDTEGEQADGQNAEQPAENETETTTQQPETSGYTEDPALRAEADRLREEEGEAEYQQFCLEHDIKIYSNAGIDQDYVEDEVLVNLRKANSAHGDPIPDFSCVEYESIEEATYYTKEPDYEFTRSFVIKLKKKGKQDVLDAIKVLEQLEYVLVAAPNYKLYPN